MPIDQASGSILRKWKMSKLGSFKKVRKLISKGGIERMLRGHCLHLFQSKSRLCMVRGILRDIS